MSKETLDVIKSKIMVELSFPVLEGGWFFPAYRIEDGSYRPPVANTKSLIPHNIVGRTPSSGGYYALIGEEVGALHRVAAVEHYTWMEGNPVRITFILPGGAPTRIVLGRDARHVTVPGGSLHALEALAGDASFSLLHLVSVPGFQPEDVTIPSRDEVVALHPAHAVLLGPLAMARPPRPLPPPMTPYMVPCADGVLVRPILTVGDSVGGYRFAGAPDGLGAYSLSESRFELAITHELFFHTGIPRAHGGVGAFVSRWTIDTSAWEGGDGSLAVLSGRDAIQTHHYWSHGRGEYKSGKALPLERLCSADLPPVSATQFTDADGVTWGTAERMLLGGEETHTQYRPMHGRALAHILTGAVFENGKPKESIDGSGHTWELPRLGRLSFENVVLCPISQRMTIAAMFDDATNLTGPRYSKRAPKSELYIFIGDKQRTGTIVEQAGLGDGVLYGVQVHNTEYIFAESREHGFARSGYTGTARFSLVQLSDQAEDHPKDEPGAALQKESIAKGVTQFLRLEDGAWEPTGENPALWFVTTDRYGGNSRLFRLRFDDITNPRRGGDIAIMQQGLVGTRRRFQMLDSLTVDTWGRVLIQEDSGDEPDLSRTLVYEPGTDTLRCAASSNPALFGASGTVTSNDEGSGIIPVFEMLGDGWYLTNLQAHTGFGSEVPESVALELVEKGQLLALYIPEDLTPLPLIP